MSQEHFLPQPFDSALYLKLTEDMVESNQAFIQSWPWSDPVSSWVDHLLNLSTIPESMSVFLDALEQGRGRLSLRIDGVVVAGVEFPAEQYVHLVQAICDRMTVSPASENQFLREGFLLTQSGQKHWVGVVDTVVGKQISIIFQRINDADEPLSHWPESARIAVEQMYEHPNGLIVCCHRGWSLSQNDTIIDLFKGFSDKHRQARVGWITEGLQAYLSAQSIADVTQVCVDGSPSAWEDAARALVAQDLDVFYMRGRNEAEVMTQAILTALEDRFVIVDVSHLGVLETLNWLFHDLSHSPDLIVSTLLGVVGTYRHVRAICPNCVHKQRATDLQLRILENYGRSELCNHLWSQPAGCPSCYGIGYTPHVRLTIAESVYFDQDYANFFRMRPVRAGLFQTLKDRGFCNYFDQALEFALQGRTSLHEAIRVGLARRCEL